MAIRSHYYGAMEYLAADHISARHAFTTRIGGVSAEQFTSLNLWTRHGDAMENVVRNYEILANALDFSTKNAVLTHQVHSDIVRTVTKQDALGLDHHHYPECDALITNDPGTALVIFTADCTPILFHDPVTGAVGAAHAGWRGTAANIGGKTVAAMVSAFGCKPENIRAAIGPNIGPCCFETGEEVPLAMEQTYGIAAKEFVRAAGDKYYVNLKEMNALSLRAAGVRHIEISEECTFCQNHRFWSHRFTRGVRGSQGAIIVR